MRTTRLLLAFAAGVALYQVTVVFAGALAANAVPKAYFERFGQEHRELALAALQFFVVAVPIIVAVAIGTLATLRALGGETKANLFALLGGLLACFVFWLVSGLFPPPLESPAQAFPPLVLLRQVLLPPWWAASGSLAPWLGFALAAWLAVHLKHGEA